MQKFTTFIAKIVWNEYKKVGHLLANMKYLLYLCRQNSIIE